MQSPRWHVTADTREAAAFATLGIETQIRSTLIESAGKRVVRFHLAPASPCGTYITGQIRRDFKSGTLIQRRPVHPFTAIMAGLINRECFLRFLHDAVPFRLAELADTGIHRLVPGDTGLPGITGSAPVIKTRDLNLLAALITAGLPPLHVDGAPAARVFYIAARVPHLPAIDGAILTHDWRRDPDSAPFDGPFHLAARALAVRQQLVTMIRREIDTIVISKPGTSSHVLIQADAPTVAWDKATRFLGGF